MNWFKSTVAVATMALLIPNAAVRAEDIKIGLVATLSGPSATIGTHLRDGFLLALKELGGKLGGQPTQVIVADDELKPDVGVQKVKALIERDKVNIVAGIVFSNVMMAVSKPVFESKTFLISGNAGPSPLAGKGCSPYFFSVSWQNDQYHEVMGKYAEAKGYKKVVLMAPNYQAGKDAMAGFKRFYKGAIADEIFTQLGQLDFSAELSKIDAAAPDALFVFMPGGMGVNLVKQYNQSGLAAKVPLLSTFTVDETTLPATQDAAVGLLSASHWAPGLDLPANKSFVENYEKAYGTVPSSYASQGYDLAKLIDGALKQTNGVISDKEAFRKALASAPFTSVRGGFAFNSNGFPIQDFYVTKAVKRADGKFVTEIVQKVFEKARDAYAADCPLK